ncbi:unnamed protein product [Ceutorhynchus assimilis]|uniref:CHK kinase-like domain-containing protein n=1 Tax=Ceutorhynchus assimilis TaxID=467358 RepID=A0A9N9MRK9_9CUCU|nr:unnamed protein product [Ceutorhynchus assimilis]
MTSPEKNNLHHLKVILKSLSKHQALVLNENVESTSDYSVNTIAKLDSPIITNLQQQFSSNQQLLLKSIWTPNSVKIVNNSCVFAKNPTTKILPPAFDGLMFIFALSDNKFRQKHFEHLVQYYFDCLKDDLENKKIVSKFFSETQVRILLPIVKFELLAIETNNKQLATNIDYYLKYPLLNQEDIYVVIKNYLGTTDYDLNDYQLIELKETNGHLGEYYHLRIKITHNRQPKEIELFAKFLIIKAEILRKVLENGPGKREDFFYNTLYPLYIEHGLQDILDFAPKCYLSRISWLIVLDDLTKTDFISFKPNVLLDFNGLSCLVEKLAKFHSTTLILEEILTKKSGKTFRLDDLYDEYFDDVLLSYNSNNPTCALYDKNLERLYYVAEKFPEIISSLKLSSEDLNKALKDIYWNLFCQLKPENCKLRSIVNHGDTYISNFLFKYDNNDKNIIKEAILIDFQLLRYMPPGYELLFALISSSSKTTRDKYLQRLIEEYYNNISKYLKHFNIDPEEVFPEKLFMENIKKAYPAALTQSFNYGLFIHIDPDFREEIMHDQYKLKYYLEDHKSAIIDKFWNDDHYRSVLKGFIEDFVELIRKGC